MITHKRSYEELERILSTMTATSNHWSRAYATLRDQVEKAMEMKDDDFIKLRLRKALWH